MAKKNKEELKVQLSILEAMIEYEVCEDSLSTSISAAIKGLLHLSGLNAEQAAARYGVTPRTLRRWMAEHDFPSGKHAGKKELVFYCDELAEWEITHQEFLGRKANS